jgi:hypothetical protein
VGCVPGKVPESDSEYSFNMAARIPTDHNVYTISGEVIGDIGSLVRQTSRAYGHVSGGGTYVSGAYFGPEYKGKGFVRLLVENSDCLYAPKGEIVILKMTDTKGAMLLPGDFITLKCRVQYEAVASIFTGEEFDQEIFATWEVDYCRLVSPVVSNILE